MPGGKLQCQKELSRDSYESEATSTEGNSGIVVAVRIRPLSTKELSSGIRSCCEVIDDSVVAIKKGADGNAYLKSQMASISEYGFDHAFGEQSTQYEVYSKTTKRFINNVIQGQNVTIFAYGATGAGMFVHL